ncbi:MAG: hypothetical protein GWP03_07250 [Proteobacteria bacterium]|nr:hypothetical protein [Pseudomonadota bacterium]
MKKFLLFTAVVLMVTGTAFATGNAIAFGTNPASQTMPVQVSIPKIVFINVDNSNHQVTFDFSTMADYPDTTNAAYPWWYLPTDPASPNVNVKVWTNDNSGYTLTAKGDQDFGSGLALSDLYYAPAGEAKTANGTSAAGGNWTAFSTSDQTIVDASSKTNGFETYNQDYELKIDGDENAGGPFNTVTITYTITGK